MTSDSHIELKLLRALLAARAELRSEIQTQYQIGSYRVDLAIPVARVVVEADGHEFHSSPDQKAADAQRDRFLTMEGWRVLRFTGREIHANPGICAQEVLALIDQAPPVPPVPERDFGRITSDGLSAIGEQQFGIPTGFSDLDFFSNGLQPDQLCLLAGRTQMGATTLALQIAINAVRRGWPILFVSAQHSRAEIVSRCQSLHLEGELHLIEARDATIENVIYEINEVKKKTPSLALVVIDDLAGLKADHRIPRAEVMEEIVRQLKNTCRHFHLAILGTLRLPPPRNWRFTRPLISDLDPRSLEWLADVLWLLHFDLRSENPRAELVLAKGNGPSTSVELGRAPGVNAFFEIPEE